MKLMRSFWRLTVNGFLAAALLVFPAAAQQTVVVRGGTVMNPDGSAVENAVVLIEDGVISAVGADTEIPYDAKVYEAEGKVVFPGMVLAHTSRGLDASNENLSVSPFVDVYDSLDPSDLFFEDSLRNGVTTMHVMVAENCVIGGMSRVVRPVGMMVEDMTIRPEGGLKISMTPKRGYNRMTQMGELRKAFFDLDQHVLVVAERRYEEEQKKQDKKVLLPPDEAAQAGMEHVRLEDLAARWQTLYRLKNGEIPVWLYCGTASDTLRGIDELTTMKLLDEAVFVLGSECFKAVEEIKATGRPVVLSGTLVHRERDLLTGKEKETFVPKVFADAGVKFALQTSSGSMGEGMLWYQASRLVREGLERTVALQAITQWPADILGLGDQLGSLAAGKFGNLVILSGDPLAQSSVVEYVFIDGKQVYDRSKDRRLEELLSGEETSE